MILRHADTDQIFSGQKFSLQQYAHVFYFLSFGLFHRCIPHRSHDKILNKQSPTFFVQHFVFGLTKNIRQETNRLHSHPQINQLLQNALNRVSEILQKGTTDMVFVCRDLLSERAGRRLRWNLVLVSYNYLFKKTY